MAAVDPLRDARRVAYVDIDGPREEGRARHMLGGLKAYEKKLSELFASVVSRAPKDDGITVHDDAAQLRQTLHNIVDTVTRLHGHANKIGDDAKTAEIKNECTRSVIAIESSLEKAGNGIAGFKRDAKVQPIKLEDMDSVIGPLVGGVDPEVLQAYAAPLCGQVSKVLNVLLASLKQLENA